MTRAVDRLTALDLLYHMLRIRRFEEKCVELYSLGKIRGFLHLYIGEEAIAAGAIRCLAPDDAVVATYREHGHALMRGTPMKNLMAELFGKVTGCARGRGGSMHFFDASRRFYGGLAIVAGGLPVAVGLALADANVLEDVGGTAGEDLIEHLGQEQRVDDVARHLHFFDEGRLSSRHGSPLHAVQKVC